MEAGLIKKWRDEFIETLENGAKEDERELAATALGTFVIKDERVVNTLFRVVGKEYNSNVVRAAIRSLTKIGVNPVPAIRKRIEKLYEERVEMDELAEIESENISAALKMFEVE